MPDAIPVRPSRRVLVLLAFAVIYVGWGSTFLAIRYAVDAIPPFVMAGTRNLVAGTTLVLLGLATGGAWPTARAWGLALVIGGLMFVVNHGGISWAEQRIPSGVTALLVATIPLWIVVLEWVFGLGRRPSVRMGLGLALGFLGSALLFSPGAAGTLDRAGTIVTAGAAVCWALGTIVARRSRLSESVLMATGLPMVAGGSALYLLALVTGEWAQADAAAVTPRALAALGYLIVMGSLLGFSAYTWLLRAMPAARVATYAYVNPVVALAIGAALGGEAVTSTTLWAGGLSLVGVFLVVSE